MTNFFQILIHLFESKAQISPLWVHCSAPPMLPIAEEQPIIAVARQQNFPWHGGRQAGRDHEQPVCDYVRACCSATVPYM